MGGNSGGLFTAAKKGTLKPQLLKLINHPSPSPLSNAQMEGLVSKNMPVEYTKIHRCGRIEQKHVSFGSDTTGENSEKI